MVVHWLMVDLPADTTALALNAWRQGGAATLQGARRSATTTVPWHRAA